MKLYARRTSSNCQKVLWFLAELELDYAFVATGGDAGGLDDPAYRALNPNGAVPTLMDGDLAVWESHAILRYLAAAHGGEVWWPSDPAARSLLDRWLDWSQSGFDRFFMDLFWGHWRTPEPDRDVERNRWLARRAAHCLGTLDGVLAERRYVAGNTFSVADVPVGALMYRYANLDATADLPLHVARWYDALAERKPFQTHVMLPFEELRGRLRH